MAVPRGWKAASWLEQLLPMQEVSGTAGLGHWQGELSVFLGEWMVSGLLALLGGPLLFVCRRLALSRGACTYPPLCALLKALFPQPGCAPSS